MNASMHSCIHIFIYSFLYSYLFISFMYSCHVFIYSYTFYISFIYALTYSYIHIVYAYIHILSYTCFYCQMLLYCISYTFPYYLLCHVFTMPIIHIHILILMLCHLLLISIVLSIYAFLSCVPSMFHLIHFGITIIYSYHLCITVMSLSIHIPSIVLSCSIYSFMYDNHMFTSYTLIFICAYHSGTLDYHILRHILSYLIISYNLYLSYLMTHPYTFLYLYILLRNWNQSNRIIQHKVMAFSCQLVNLPITLGTVCITHFSGVLNSYFDIRSL